MGKVAEQFDGVVSAANSNVQFVQMWIGPRTRDEIQKAIEGKPTLCPVPVGPNLNDGDGVHGFKKRKGFYTMEEMYRWLKDQKPDEQKFPCPQCMNEDGSPGFIAKTANELVNHMEKAHPSGVKVSTPDYEGVKDAKFQSEVDRAVDAKLAEIKEEKPKNKGGRPKKQDS